MVPEALEFLADVVVNVWLTVNQRWWKLGLFLALAIAVSIVIVATMAK